MVGVGYGKGVDLPEGSVRWIAVSDAQVRIETAAPWLLDARDAVEYQAGTLPGTTHLAQNSLMFESRSGHVQRTLDDILADASRDIILFANTAGVGGMTAGRDLWVLAFLHELGVPCSRMMRLEGGFNNWQDAGRAVEVPCRPDALEVQESLEPLLVAAGLPHLFPLLDASGETLASCAALAALPRSAMLEYLTRLKIGLNDRQRLAGVLAKAYRDGAFGNATPAG
jgi:rhodanese-related sulfurtransferase